MHDGHVVAIRTIMEKDLEGHEHFSVLRKLLLACLLDNHSLPIMIKLLTYNLKAFCFEDLIFAIPPKTG
jgi:hypothetical protein